MFDADVIVADKSIQPTCAPAVADVNGDNRADLVVADGSQVIVVLPGNGDGTFQARLEVDAGAPTSFVTAADLSGDGRADLVVSHPSSASISVLLGTGSGGFAAPVTHPTGTDPGPVAVGDLNGDLIPDLAVATSSGVSVLLGTGNGSLGLATSYAPIARAIALADFNQDGDLDAAVIGGADPYDTRLFLALGAGDGSLGPPAEVEGLGDPGGLVELGVHGVVSGDFNGDGIPDLATSRSGQYGARAPTHIPHYTQILKLLGNGNGTFQPASVALEGLGSGDAFTAGDLNLDGHSDLVSFSNDGGYGTFLIGTSLERLEVDGNPLGLSVGDLDADGYPDLVLGVHGVGVSLNNRDGTVGQARRFLGGMTLWGMATGDLNHDEIPDLALSYYDQTVIAYGLGDGTMRYGPHLKTQYIQYHLGIPAIADVDQDSLPDLLLMGSDGVAIFHGTGSDDLGPEMTYGGLGDSIFVGDQDGDGYTDVIVGQRSILYGRGDGTYDREQVFSGLGSTGAVADFDGDSRPDSVGLSGTVDVWLRDDGGALQPAGSYSGAPRSEALLVEDFDLDGRPDVVVAGEPPSHELEGSVHVLLNRASEATSTPVLVSLAHAIVEDGVVKLAWYAPGAGAEAWRLYRWSDGGWTFVASLTADGTGTIAYEDRDVSPGRQYAYRLGMPGDNGESLQGEVWVDVPALPLALEGAVPNPTPGRRLMVRFTLSTPDAATLELFDLSGRRLAEKQVGMLGPGPHAVDLGEGASRPSGMYFLRLSQAGTSVVKKAVVVP